MYIRGLGASQISALTQNLTGPSVSDEDWAYGDGYYLDNFGDIDDMADMGVIEMPYQVSCNCARKGTCYVSSPI